jgi:hypothetical protein
MGTLVIRCPNTGKIIPVGFEPARPPLPVRPGQVTALQCPACGHLHYWQEKDVWLEPRRLISATAASEVVERRQLNDRRASEPSKPWPGPERRTRTRRLDT